MKAFEVGDIVEHPTFGTGEVNEIDKQNGIVWVCFDFQAGNESYGCHVEHLKHFNINELIQ